MTTSRCSMCTNPIPRTDEPTSILIRKGWQGYELCKRCAAPIWEALNELNIPAPSS